MTSVLLHAKHASKNETDWARAKHLVYNSISHGCTQKSLLYLDVGITSEMLTSRNTQFYRCLISCFADLCCYMSDFWSAGYPDTKPKFFAITLISISQSNIAGDPQPVQALHPAGLLKENPMPPSQPHGPIAPHLLIPLSLWHTVRWSNRALSTEHRA